MKDDRLAAELAHLCDALRGTFIEQELVIAGSSTLFGIETDIPPLTEDLDLLIAVELLETREEDVLRLFDSLGYRNVEGTPTFVSGRGNSFDLVGYSHAAIPDHVGGGKRLKAMVFRDLSVIMASPDAVVAGPGGLRALSPAAFCVVKLLTVRLEKGAKDKLQALLVIAERLDDAEFVEAFVRLMRCFESGQTEEVLPDAQMAALALSPDPTVSHEGGPGYARFYAQAQQGLDILRKLEARYRASE